MFKQIIYLLLSKILCCSSFWLSWDNKYNCAIDNVISIKWFQCKYQMHQITKKFMLLLILLILDQTNAIVPLMMPLTTPDAGANGITSPKSQVTVHFNHPDLRNLMVPLITLLASCVTDTGSNGITWSKRLCCTFFNCLDLMNAMVLLTMLLTSHDADVSANSVKWLKTSCCTHVANMGITWQKCHVGPHFNHLNQTKWWQCHQHQVIVTLVPTASHEQKGHLTPCFNYLHLMIKMVPLMMQLTLHDSNAGTNGITWLKNLFHFILIIVIYWMQWCHWQYHWHSKDMSRHLYTFLDVLTQRKSRHFVDISRHCLDMWSHVFILADIFYTYQDIV